MDFKQVPRMHGFQGNPNFMVLFAIIPRAWLQQQQFLSMLTRCILLNTPNFYARSRGLWYITKARKRFFCPSLLSILRNTNDTFSCAGEIKERNTSEEKRERKGWFFNIFSSLAAESEIWGFFLRRFFQPPSVRNLGLFVESKKSGGRGERGVFAGGGESLRRWG